MAGLSNDNEMLGKMCNQSHDVICDESHPNLGHDQVGDKWKRDSFIIESEFNTLVSKDKCGEAIKWRDLPVNTLFKVEAVKQFNSASAYGNGISMLGHFQNEREELVNVWLPDIVKKELCNKKLDFTKELVFIRSNGLKWNKKGSRQYFHFDLVTKWTYR